MSVMERSVPSFAIFIIFGFMGVFISLVVAYGAENLGWDVSFVGMSLAQVMNSIIIIFIIIGLFFGVASAMMQS